ncbi:MAG: YdeI/OmpD-associated family protein [Oryzihumus sp.]
MAAAQDRDHVLVESRAFWRTWLEQHHTRAAGVWVVTWKKASGGPHVPRLHVVEEALCFGRVDSLPRTLDDPRMGQRHQT